MKILHIITDLDEGGTQKFLLNLCNSTSERHEHTIVSLKNIDSQLKSFNNKKFKIILLNFNSFPFGFICSFCKLIGIIILNNPKIVQTWLHHANFVGGLVAFLTGNRKIIWNIRDSSLDASNKLSTKMITLLASKLSFIIPQKIVYNSKEAQKRFTFNYHFSKKKSFLIRNGFDPKVYNIKEELRIKFRKSNNINENEIVLGLVSRFHPVKNHVYLFQTLELVKKKFPHIKCILVGKNNDKSNIFLMKMIHKYQLAENILLLGIKRNICEIMNGIDIKILCSKSEAFPNVLGEAMLCGTPCISTDVGDARDIISKNGWVVPLNDPYIFSQTIISAIHEIKNDKLNLLSLKTRAHIQNYFSKDKTINEFLNIWGVK